MTTRTQSGFVGRDTDIQQVHAMLSDDNCRLVTILGMGGIGKTSLLNAVLNTLPSTFEHSPVMVNGQPITHHSQLASAITERLGIALSDKTNIVDELVLHLSKKPMLLAIDNFEHLLDASGFIHHLLENTPSLKIIVTSRETLRLSHEFVYSLRGLAVPPATALRSEIADYPSVRLFVNKSLQGRQNFEPDFSKIAEICRLIDGNPLAIDLAAVWTKVLDTDAILAEIQSCVDFLESNLRDTPERHRSIRAVFTGSWQLLTPAEQDVLKRLSIFKDKFTREAAQVVVNANLRTLLALRDKSLLTVYDNGFYCLHSLVQQLAYEYLIADSAVANETREKYLSYYADLTAQLGDALCGSEQASALETMQHAIHNIRVAWAWSVEHQRVDLIDKFLLGIALYFEMRSQTHEGASLLTIAPHLLSQLPDAVRARIQLLLGWQSIIMWQNEKGTCLISEAVALLDDYPLWFGMALVPAMNHPELLGDAYSGLFAHIESELNTADDTWQRAWLLKAIGEYHYVSHDYEVATDNLQQSANHFEQAGDAWGIAWAYGNLGRAFIHMEKYQAAEAIYEDSIAICQRLNDVTGWIDVINKQAELALAQMQLTKAETILYGGFQIAHENDSPTGVYTYLLFTLAKARIEQERYADAVQYFEILIHEPIVNLGWREPEINALHAYKLQIKPYLTSASYQEAEKRGQGAEIIATIQRLLDGTNTTIERETIASTTLIEPLTEREEQILRFIAAGLTNREIADQLTVAVGTVKTHAHNLYSKLGVSNRTEATTRAHELNLV